MTSSNDSRLPGELSPLHERQTFEDVADLAATMPTPSRIRSRSPAKEDIRTRLGLARIARRTLGILLLLVTVFLWTMTNFMASFIFSDQTFNKPFFLVYFNTSAFAISLVPAFRKYIKEHGIHGLRRDTLRMWDEYKHKTTKRKVDRDDDDAVLGERLLVDEDSNHGHAKPAQEKLNFKETAVLSLEFCVLWFVANYFASACLEYTSVASVTILTSTSSAWTLIIGSMFGVELFTVRKLMGVMASLIGVILISMVDLSGKSDEDRGSFPYKSPGEIAIGDAMALISAVIYSIYVTVMKRRVGDEEKVNMQLFFGLVGFFNLLFLWPVFFILHWTGLETFELPPSGQVWAIIIGNSLASYISDISWAYAMLLTSPLVVTVGLSLTIPLSLLGEMVQYDQYSGALYWVGAAVVFVSFVFVNHESRDEDDKKSDDERAIPGGTV